MDLVVELTRERGMSTILITHDLGLAAAYCDRIVVMEKGRSWRPPRRPASSRAGAPLHAQADARRRHGSASVCATCCRWMTVQRRRRPPRANAASETGAAADGRKSGQGISAQGHRRRRWRACSVASDAEASEVFRAVDGISFTIRRGESVGLVGESGCGKSTTSMMVMRLLDATAGRITFAGEDIGAIPAQRLRPTAAAQAHPDGVPGSDRQPQSALYRGPRHRRSAAAARRRRGAAPRCGRAARSWRGRSACRWSCSTASRISCRAARRRASASRAPSRFTRS